jgi:hypothetical protein
MPMLCAHTLAERAAAVISKFLPFGNVFSNANRAADHIRAYGHHWRDAPAPRAFGDNAIPRHVLEAVYQLFESEGLTPARGYFA